MSKILIVEDDLSIQALLHDFIQEAGYSVELAADGVEALCGYTGMYLLVREVGGENMFYRQDGAPSVPLKWIAALAAFLYSCIPFLAVYGLAEFGLPMLFWCALQMRKGKNLAAAFSYTVLYAMCSSLVLIGFGVLGLGLAWIATLLFFRKKQGNRDRRGVLYPGMAWLLVNFPKKLHSMR